MREAEAREIMRKHNNRNYDSRSLNYKEAWGYLECYEKANGLEDAIIHASEYFQYNKKEIMYSQMKASLAKWEKEK